jgi:t-SNARE complex subunit (syntaxin)
MAMNETKDSNYSEDVEHQERRRSMDVKEPMATEDAVSESDRELLQKIKSVATFSPDALTSP